MFLSVQSFDQLLYWSLLVTLALKRLVALSCVFFFIFSSDKQSFFLKQLNKPQESNGETSQATEQVIVNEKLIRINKYNFLKPDATLECSLVLNHIFYSHRSLLWFSFIIEYFFHFKLLYNYSCKLLKNCCNKSLLWQEQSMNLRNSNSVV